MTPTMFAQSASASHQPLNIVTLLGRLEKSGMKRETAEIFVETVVEVQEHNAATKLDLKETEAKLTLDIEMIRSDLKGTEARLNFNLKETEAKLTLDIEMVRRDLKETEASLKLDTEMVRRDLKETEARLNFNLKETEAKLTLDIEKVRGEIKSVEMRLIRWMIGLTLGNTALIVGILGFLIKFS